jgi:pyruvate dehydrogenase E2 component (dihydrolipoamide acetyltransferase)
MAVKVMMPKGSDTMEEGKVLKWLKNEGDAISTGDAIVEIETDKVNMEVEAMGSGILRKILVPAGSGVPVGTLMGVIAKADEDISGLLKPVGAPAATAADHGKPPSAPATQSSTSTKAAATVASAPAVGGTAPPPSAPANGGRIFASPLAKRMAKDLGYELAEIPGSGPNGRIVRLDVERRAAHAPAGRAGGPTPFRAPALQRRPTAAPTGPEFSDEPLTSMRKVIATRLVQSKSPVPHFYLTMEVNMQRVKELRESVSLLDPGLKISYNDIVLKASAAALRQVPEVNASFQGETIRYHNRVNLGIAVATDGGGLITPVLRNADAKSLAEIAGESKDLVARARARKLLPEEYTGSTFSISNLGMLGIDEFSAIINPPEGAILAVGAVAEKAVVVDGRVEAGLRCRLTLSCDHRVVDGALGAKFLQSLKQILENPVYLAF